MKLPTTETAPKLDVRPITSAEIEAIAAMRSDAAMLCSPNYKPKTIPELDAIGRDIGLQVLYILRFEAALTEQGMGLGWRRSVNPNGVVGEMFLFGDLQICPIETNPTKRYLNVFFPESTGQIHISDANYRVNHGDLPLTPKRSVQIHLPLTKNKEHLFAKISQPLQPARNYNPYKRRVKDPEAEIAGYFSVLGTAFDGLQSALTDLSTIPVNQP